MLCPICSKQLVEHQSLFRCADNHGTLVTGKYLSDIEDKPVPEPSGQVLADTKHEIHCPHCAAMMHKVDYNGTSIMIDACTKCHYRWLDAGEIAKIKNHDPKINPQDLLYIADVDEQMRQSQGREVKEANPRLPLQGSWRGGSEVVGGNRANVRYGAIAGQGLFGIYKGLTHSKTSRILTLVAMIIFGLLVYLFFLDGKNSAGL